MTSSTLISHLNRTRRDLLEPLRVLVVHDGRGARKRVERLLTRIRCRFGADLRMACAYQRLEELRRGDGRRKPPQIELLFLAAGCSATLPQATLAAVTSLLPSLKDNHGALAFLSGTKVPRQMDVLLVEHFLRTHSKRAGVAFFSGYMPGLGCPGCSTPKRTNLGRSAAKRFCVLHAPPNVGPSTHPCFSQESKPTRMKRPPDGPAKARKQALLEDLRNQPRRERREPAPH
jgi:hypothetical protein